MTADAWVAVVASLILVWFGLDAYDRVRKANARIEADLEVFEAAHPRPEGEQ